MSKSGYKYILRCAIEPGFHEKEKLADLSRFCREAQIDDVMFFINCEELNQGHLTLKETAPWMKLIRKAKTMLADLNVTTSINPWITLLHCDRGRTLRKEQEFRLMVDPYGHQTRATVCPLCPEWRAYIAEMYACYAGIQPWMLWVEDDFRLHNHQPLTWGGCFCDQHLKIFGQLAGRKVSREDLVEGVLKPGKPHPYRKMWLDLNGRTMTDLAGLIGQAVHRVSPATMVGLMSSNPAVHAAEGRDWPGIVRNLAGATTPVSRPHLPSYGESTPPQYLWSSPTSPAATQACLPPDTELYPELENAPYTRYSKSWAFTAHQLTMAVSLGAKGITLNIFDMMGNGPNLSLGWQRMLADRKPFLNKTVGLNLALEQQAGVRVLFSPQSSYHIHTNTGGQMEELYPEETSWASLLTCLNIACRLEQNYRITGRVVAVSGQYFRSIPRAAVTGLLKNNLVLLNAESAETLYRLGLGNLAGIRDLEWLPADENRHSYEQFRGQFLGLSDPRISTQRRGHDVLKIRYTPGIRTLSDVRTAAGAIAAPGVTIHRNTVIFPFKTNQLQLNPFRQAQIQMILRRMAPRGESVTFIPEQPYLAIYRYDRKNETILLVVNCSTDDVDDFRIYCPDLSVEGKIITAIDSRTGKERKIRVAKKDGLYYFNVPISSKEALVFRTHLGS